MDISFAFMGAENLGIEHLSSVSKKAGHNTSLFFDPAVFSGKLMLDSPALARLTDKKKSMLRTAAVVRPQILALSCFSGNFLWALDFARSVRAVSPLTKTIFGGVHVTSCPDVVIAEDCVDALLIGEGESVFNDLIRSVADSSGAAVPGAWIKHNGDIIKSAPLPLIEDLDSLPHPDKSLFYKAAPALEHHYMIMAARGCPFSCTYCYKSLDTSSPPGSKPVRMRSVDSVIDELLPFKQRGRMKMVVFRDDVFGTKKDWLEDFSEKYSKHIALPYFCYTHPGTVDDERAALLRRSGCVFTTMGVQSADDNVRREVLNRRYTNKQVVDSVSALKKNGIRVSLDQIVGLPGETKEQLLDAAKLYVQLRPDRLLTFWLECFPGTAIMRIAREQGLLSADDEDRIRHGHAGYRYSGGSLGGATSITRIVNFLNTLPLIPPTIAESMIRKGTAARFPASSFLQIILMVANAFRIRDPFFFYNIRFMFSRKKTFSRGGSYDAHRK